MTAPVDPVRPAVATLLLATGVTLLVPLLAMQVTDEVRWGVGDFLAMAVLLLGFGGAGLLLRRRVGRSWGIAVAVAALTGFLWVWAELAVGVFTTWGS